MAVERKLDLIWVEAAHLENSFDDDTMGGEKEYEEAVASDLNLKFTSHTHNMGLATYFREYLRDYMKKWVADNKKPDGSDYDIYKDGLKIYTTIDSRMQTYAEEAVAAGGAVDLAGKE